MGAQFNGSCKMVSDQHPMDHLLHTENTYATLTAN
jgi:hypothetical protein